MKVRKRVLALVMVGVMAAGVGGSVAMVQNHPFRDLADGYDVGDTFDGQIVYQVDEETKTVYTAPDRPCIHEDGSGQELPCVWRADRRGNLKGDSVIIVPDGEGDRTVIRFTE